MEPRSQNRCIWRLFLVPDSILIMIYGYFSKSETNIKYGFYTLVISSILLARCWKLRKEWLHW